MIGDITLRVDLDDLNRKMTLLLQQGDRIMAVLDELRSALAAANEQLNQNALSQGDIAADLDDLIMKLANNPPGSQEVIDATAEAKALLAQMTAQADAARALAAKHTPTP